MARLTEANYLSRRVSLLAKIDEAKAEFSDLGLKRELDAATDDEVRIAKDALGLLEDRLVALDAAFERSQAEASVAAQRLRDVAAAESHAQIATLLDQRKAAGEAMDEAAKQLSARYAEYADAGRHITQIALGHASRFGRDRLGNLTDLFRGNFHDVRPAIGRTLTRGGLNMTGINADGFASDHAHQQSITAFTNWSNTRAVQHVAILVTEKEAE